MKKSTFLSRLNLSDNIFVLLQAQSQSFVTTCIWFYRCATLLSRRTWRRWNTTQRIFFSLVSIELVTLLCCFAIPLEGKILPVGKQVTDAYSLLQQCPTGRTLIKKVSRTTRGSFIYLTLGDTKNDDLFDYNGDSVCAVTRANFRFCSGVRSPRSVIVIVNKDIIGTEPENVTKSLAFELENVHYAFKRAFFERLGQDSPLAALTKQKVIQELGL